MELDSSSAPSDTAGPAWTPSKWQCFVATFAGGVLFSLLTFSLYPYIPFRSMGELGISPKPEVVAEFRAAHHEYWPRNHAVAYGVIGLCLGIAWGALTTPKLRFVCSLTAGLSAAICGAIAGYCTGPFFAKAAIESAEQSLAESAMFHGAVWVAVLVPLFFVLGYFQESVAKAITGALYAAILAVAGVMTYLLCGSILVPGENLAALIPSAITARVLWVMCFVVIIGLGGFYAFRPQNRS